MSAATDFVDFILERLSPLGGVSSRAMFGGHGIDFDGLMLGLIADDVFYLKADDENRPMFEQAGSRPFTYHRRNRHKPIAMSYWEVPPFLFEHRDQLCDWAMAAHAAAARSRRTTH